MGRQSLTSVPAFLARREMDDLIANGGQVTRQPPQADGIARVLLTFGGAADRDRCRAILAGVKADPAIWAAMLRLLDAPAVTGAP